MTPLRPETIGKGKFKGILPLDRWMVDPALTRRIKDMGPDLGKPEFYDVVTTATGIPAWRIHHSRLIRFDGVTLPFQQKMTENEWGMSVVERIWDRLTAFDSATVGAAQLVYKAHLRTYSVEKHRLVALLVSHWCGCSDSPRKDFLPVMQTLPTITIASVRCRRGVYVFRCGGYWTSCIVRNLASRCRTISRLSLTRSGKCLMSIAQRWR